MKIKTINGWESFSGVKKTEVDIILRFSFESGKTFRCTPNHIIYIESDLPLWAEMLSVGEYIEIYGKKEKIVSIDELSGKFFVYDILDVENKNNYICSGLNVSNCEEFWISNFPAVSSFKKSKVVIISTPRGKFNLFYDLYNNARTREEKIEYISALKTEDKTIIFELDQKQGKKNAFVSANFNYMVVPGRDEEWAKEQRSILGDVKFAQEYECCDYYTQIYINDINNKINIGDLYEQLKLENNEKTFENLYLNIKDYKIYTPNGFIYFKGIRKLENRDVIKITFENKLYIIVTKNHIFKEKCANELSINDELYNRKHGYLKIVDIEELGKRDVYDILDVSDDHYYYTNDFISHNCSFTGSIHTILVPETLERLEKEYRDPSEIEFGGSLKIYERPVEGKKYILGVDPAKGTGKNASCIQVLKIDSLKPIKLKQVAVFKDNKTDPYRFSQILNRLGLWYNTGLVMVENNGEGSAVIQHIWYTFEYQNLYSTSNKSSGLGIRSHKTSKTKAVLLMKKLIEEKMLDIIDYETVKQLSVFIETDKGEFKGQDNEDDDLVAALWWAAYSIDLDIWDEDINVIEDSMQEEAWGILNDVDIDNDWEFF